MKHWSKQERTTIRLDPELHRRVKVLAVETGTTFTKLVDAALRDILARRGRGRKGARK